MAKVRAKQIELEKLHLNIVTIEIFENKFYNVYVEE
jgi:hypothetical protein